MNKRNRRVFTDEFKLEALRLVEETDKTMSQVSRDLGIGNNLLGRWKRNSLFLNILKYVIFAGEVIPIQTECPPMMFGLR